LSYISEISFNQGWVFATAKSIFARTVEKKLVKTAEKKTAKTGNKFSTCTLNWMEILWCSYNASLKLR